jgi:hypothetical protein
MRFFKSFVKPCSNLISESVSFIEENYLLVEKKDKSGQFLFRLNDHNDFDDSLLELAANNCAFFVLKSFENPKILNNDTTISFTIDLTFDIYLSEKLNCNDFVDDPSYKYTNRMTSQMHLLMTKYFFSINQIKHDTLLDSEYNQNEYDLSIIFIIIIIILIFN